MEKVYHAPLEGNQKGPILSSVLAKGRLGICNAEVLNTVASRVQNYSIENVEIDKSDRYHSVPRGKSVN